MATTDKVVVECNAVSGTLRDARGEEQDLRVWLTPFAGPVRVTIERLDRIGGNPVSAFARGGLGGPLDV